MQHDPDVDLLILEIERVPRAQMDVLLHLIGRARQVDSIEDRFARER